MCKTKMQSLNKYVSGIRSYLLDKINMVIYGTIFLLLVLVTGYFLAIYIASTIQVTDSNIRLLNLSYSVILVAITAIYAFLTWQIVNQTNKNSKIAFIEKRLEKLYYPLKDVLEHPVIKTLLGDEHKYIDINKINNIVPFQYLASKNIDESLDDFVNTTPSNRLASELIDKKSYDICTYNEAEIEKIKTMVNDDIKNYRHELKKLIKHRD